MHDEIKHLISASLYKEEFTVTACEIMTSPIFSSSSSEQPNVQGFTLVEFLCTFALLTVVAMLAAPSFASLIQKLRVHQAVMELKGALQIARSEAVRRGENIKLRKKDSTEGRSCTASASDWSCGWDVFVDIDNNGIPGPPGTADDDELIQSFPGLLEASVRFTTNSSTLTVNRWGAINGIGASFAVTPKALNDSNLDTMICISSGGRVRSTLGNSCT
ncbi:prepilin-type N-terminal cleavage/methylation domain-containing protein [Diaphorobacter sp. HDW4A]|uniref:GspH/FimT family pseudopilin n=1 Tax=Diaphorobacter sp. HDW4A TaxID=2714924 RepID=UPI00140BA264|nr:GspH/FimT family pseudopilin [Diaphorobacter sp. HDW4A]QIL83166.1 prepilin-type N-terminal cleavage/methylation domain-containing protein [Diaphorobacter sp. HDW4A]